MIALTELNPAWLAGVGLMAVATGVALQVIHVWRRARRRQAEQPAPPPPQVPMAKVLPAESGPGESQDLPAQPLRPRIETAEDVRAWGERMRATIMAWGQDPSLSQPGGGQDDLHT